MTTDMEELAKRLAYTEARLAAAEAQITQTSRWARLVGSLGLLALLVAVCMAVHPRAVAQGAGDASSSLLARVAALETKTEALTQTGTPGKSGALLRITGDNVQIVSGSGSTEDKSGLGNLNLGYNARKGHSGHTDIRTGSHNLILGDYNNYSGCAGIVAGENNTISGGSVIGGEDNTASGNVSIVIGGRSNQASGYWTYVGGGHNNRAVGLYSSVSGGENNTTTGLAASVSGEWYVTQSHEDGWSGGHYHTPIQKPVKHRGQTRPIRKART